MKRRKGEKTEKEKKKKEHLGAKKHPARDSSKR